MEKFEITKEQVLKVAELGNSKDNELIKSWFPNAFKKELKVGKWYKSNVAIFYITKIENELAYAYGIDKGIWKKECAFNLMYSKKDVEATYQEVETALINEAKKRGFVNGCTWGNGVFTAITGCYFDFYNNNLRLQGASIFKNGVWAVVDDVIQTITKEEAEKLLNKKII